MITNREPKADAGATATIQRRYDRQAVRYDFTEAPAEWLVLGRGRRLLWELIPAGSRVLEVGVGTGKNLRWHPANVTVTAVDFSPKMLARAVRRARETGAPTELALMDAQELGFEDASFDIATATCVFCSVPDPVAGLREIRRVLRPDGRLFLLEHVRSELPVIGRGMDLMNPLTVRMSGTNINRDTVGNVER